MKISRKRARDATKLPGTDKPIKDQTFVRVIEIEVPADEPMITHQEMEIRRLCGTISPRNTALNPFQTRIQKDTRP